MLTDVGRYYEQYWSPDGFYPHGGLSPELARVFEQYIPSGSRCLDLGCGDGRTSGPWLTDRGCQYVGVDVSANAIRDANALGLEAHQVDDVASLPFNDASFDAAVSIEVLEHLFLPQRALAEVMRVLRPGGIVIITVPNVAYWRRRLDMACLGRWNPLGDELSVEQPWRDPHIRFFNAGALRRLLVSEGFERVRIGGHSGAFVRDVPWFGKRLRGRPSSRLYQVAESRLPALFAFRLHAIGYKPPLGRSGSRHD